MRRVFACLLAAGFAWAASPAAASDIHSHKPGARLHHLGGGHVHPHHGTPHVVGHRPGHAYPGAGVHPYLPFPSAYRLPFVSSTVVETREVAPERLAPELVAPTIPTVLGIREAPPGRPTVFVLNAAPPSRAAAAKGHPGPRIVEIDRRRAGGPRVVEIEGGPRVVHLQVPRDRPRHGRH